MDLTTYVPRLPRPGETLLGRSFKIVPGGKGANQAVAAARLGSQVRLFGRVGRDDLGDQHMSAMQLEGVDTVGVNRDDLYATGLAVISVEDSGENCITVISGANMAVGDEDVALCKRGMAGAFLSIGHLTLFTRNMSNGCGWIAVTAALFGFNHPIGVFFTGLFFGFADAFAIRLQTTTDIPPSLVQFIPHVLTLVALVLVGARAAFFEYLARRRFRQKAEREIAARGLAGAD